MRDLKRRDVLGTATMVVAVPGMMFGPWLPPEERFRPGFAFIDPFGDSGAPLDAHPVSVATFSQSLADWLKDEVKEHTVLEKTNADAAARLSEGLAAPAAWVEDDSA